MTSSNLIEISTKLLRILIPETKKLGKRHVFMTRLKLDDRAANRP